MRRTALAAALAAAVAVGSVASFVVAGQRTVPSHTSRPVSSLPVTSLDGGVERPGGSLAAAVCSSRSECVAEQLVADHPDDPAAAIAAFDALGAAGDTALAATCHAAYHVVGRAAGRAASGADEIWVALTAAPDSCSGGYVHGVVEGLFEGRDTAAAAADVAEVCVAHSDRPDVSGNCFHGAGHALLRSLRSPLEATEACSVTLVDQAAACVDGVMMEYAAFFEQYAAAGPVEEFCRSLDPRWREACWANAAPVWFDAAGYDPAVYVRCDAAAEHAEACVRTVGALGVFYALSLDVAPATLLDDCAIIEDRLAVDGSETDRLLGACYEGVAASLEAASSQGALDRAVVAAALAEHVPARFAAAVADAVRRKAAEAGH